MSIKEWSNFKSTLKKEKKMKVLVTLTTCVFVRMSAIYENDNGTESYFIYSEGICEKLQLFGFPPKTVTLELGSSHFCISFESSTIKKTLTNEIDYLRKSAFIVEISEMRRPRRTIKRRLCTTEGKS